MKVKQSCSHCAKQSTCKKAANVENYRFDGCREFVMLDILCEDDNDDPVIFDETISKENST